MSRKKLSTTVYLDHHQDRALKELSSRTAVPVAYMIRQAINAYLEAQVRQGLISSELLTPETYETYEERRLHDAVNRELERRGIVPLQLVSGLHEK